jgi:hypothetical protein
LGTWSTVSGGLYISGWAPSIRLGTQA